MFWRLNGWFVAFLSSLALTIVLALVTDPIRRCYLYFRPLLACRLELTIEPKVHPTGQTQLRIVTLSPKATNLFRCSQSTLVEPPTENPTTWHKLKEHGM